MIMIIIVITDIGNCCLTYDNNNDDGDSDNDNNV